MLSKGGEDLEPARRGLGNVGLEYVLSKVGVVLLLGFGSSIAVSLAIGLTFGSSHNSCSGVSESLVFVLYVLVAVQ